MPDTLQRQDVTVDRRQLRNAVAEMATRYGQSMFALADTTLTFDQRLRAGRAAKRRYAAMLRLLWALD